ncbi:MAG: sn-glycerol-3-phosphate ABC transporter ATP-binding protein UgpC [Deltaproteobacteria bacterium]|nr:sn-glycerol-3-phosphate ABC transporter ATP-binding protein UgpC [Deltaproteobacteria bacterium]
MAEVILRNVCKLFGKVPVVRDFSLNIADGEFLVLVGPSGCGKSTTLRLVAGLESLSSGEIYIGDRLVNDIHPRDRDIAMVFQNYALYPQMTVYDNMAFSLKMRKVPKREIDQAIRRTSELLRIDQLLDRKPGQLSGGQRQRVALGRSIIRNPHVFLFDEPLSNLDAKLRIAMRAELLELHQRLMTTAIYVTHDQLEAMTMGDRIVVMNEGVIQQVDHPETVYDHPVNLFVAGFIGSPSMNFLDCRILQNGDSLCAATDGLRLKIPAGKQARVQSYVGRDAVLGIRPEHIGLASDPARCDCLAGFTAVVRVVESAGSEKIVHARVEDHSLVARLDPHTRLKTGETVEFAVRMETVHIFDKVTGQTLM